MLMKAVGFGDPNESLGPDKKMRRTLSLIGLPKNVTKITKLPQQILNNLETKRFEIDQELIALDGAPSVTGAIRLLRENHNIHEVIGAVETALKIVNNIILHPQDIKVYRIKTSNPNFNRQLGRLTGSDLLMRTIGFIGNDELGTTVHTQNLTDESTLKFAAYVLKAMNPQGFNFSMSGTAGSVDNDVFTEFAYGFLLKGLLTSNFLPWIQKPSDFSYEERRILNWH
jgi:hypothetical protein